MLVIWTGNITNNTDITAAHGIRWEPYYGTGTAPAANAAITGSCGTTTCAVAGPNATFTAAAAPAGTGDLVVPFNISAVITGLTPGTAVWLDLAQEGASNTIYHFSNVSVSVIEF